MKFLAASSPAAFAIRGCLSQYWNTPTGIAADWWRDGRLTADAAQTRFRRYAEMIAGCHWSPTAR